jgi:DSF synthase
VNANVNPTLLRVSIPNSNCNEVVMDYDPELATVWAYMNPVGIPSFSVGLMRQIRSQDALLEEKSGYVKIGDEFEPVDFYVGGSKTPGVYSLGGDLQLFISLIRMRDEDALRAYARKCNDCLWARLNNFGSKDLVTVALVQGTAYGGGFESALASDFIIAERGTKWMFPEFKFNLFPGMGAFTILARKLKSVDKATQMIMSNHCYSAEELHGMGLVATLAEPGEGESATRAWIREHRRVKNGLKGMLEAKRITERYMAHSISREEVDAIGDAWAKTALQISEADLKLMNRFVVGQTRNTRERNRANVIAPAPQSVVQEASAGARELVMHMAA